MPALWKGCGDAELATVFSAFKASRTPEEALTDLRRMLPSLPSLPSLPPAVRASIVRATLEAGPHDDAGRSWPPSPPPSIPAAAAGFYDDLGAPEAWALTAGEREQAP